MRFVLQRFNANKQQIGGTIEEKIQAQAKKQGTVVNPRHNALMDEFKIAHRKMFKNGQNSEAEGEGEVRTLLLNDDDAQYSKCNIVY